MKTIVVTRFLKGRDIRNQQIILKKESFFDKVEDPTKGSYFIDYLVAEILKEPTNKVWGFPYADLVMGCHMATPTNVFRAMATGAPYPVKALCVLGINTLLSYANQHQILKALNNQELIVAHEIFMTPTAMLADYVLPGDVFTERNHIADSWSWTNRLTLSQKAVDPPAQASSTSGRFLCGRIDVAAETTKALTER